MAEPDIVLRAEALRKNFGKLEVTRDVALALPRGARHFELAEILPQPLGAQYDVLVCHQLRLSTMRERKPSMPLGMNSTTTISRMPMPKYQYCGLMPAS